MLFVCSTSLLGVEAITSIFHKSVGKEDKDKGIDIDSDDSIRI